MRSQDKRQVVAAWMAGAEPEQAAARLNLPAQEVRAIYAKEKKVAVRCLHRATDGPILFPTSTQTGAKT